MLMFKVVAILETMWDWRRQVTDAGYAQAPQFFRINPKNHSGRRLYQLVGPEAKLLVTNACKELVTGPEYHGKGDPVWLRENLETLDSLHCMEVLLVCGKIAQATFRKSGYQPIEARVIEMPHPAARMWTAAMMTELQNKIQGK